MAETLSVVDMLPAQFEPHTMRRYILAIEGIDSYIVKTAARPKISFEDVALPWINSYRYISGRGKFDAMQVTLHDPIAPSGAQQVMEWVRLNYESISGRAGYSDFYKRDIELKMLDGIGTVAQKWEIKGAWIKEVDFGGLDASSDAELAEITLTIRFDNFALSY